MRLSREITERRPLIEHMSFTASIDNRCSIELAIEREPSFGCRLIGPAQSLPFSSRRVTDRLTGLHYLQPT
jgi:hypothetical protein